MKNSVLVTITGLAHYYGTKPFKVGAVIKLKKEYDNKYDDEAIRAATAVYRYSRLRRKQYIYGLFGYIQCGTFI